MDTYRSFTEKHLIPFFGSVPVSDITAESIEDFIEAKRAPGGSVRWPGKALADGSLRTGLLALRLILQRAVRMKVLAANPIKEIEWRGAQRIDQVDPFSGPELRALLAAVRRIDPDFAALLHAWAQSGMRAGEVCGLQWQDVDLEAGTALVQRTWSRHRLGPPKTGRARKVSFLHPVTDDTPDWRPGSTTEARSAVTALRRLTIRSMDPEAFVFGRGRTPRSAMQLHRAWRRVMAVAQVRYRAQSSYVTRSRPRCCRETPRSSTFRRRAGGVARRCSFVSTPGGCLTSSTAPWQYPSRPHCPNQPQPPRNQSRLPPSPRGGSAGPNYLSTQNPCASMPSAVLNLLRKFSSAIAAVSSTSCASLKWRRSRPWSSSVTRCPVTVIASAYSIAAFSLAEKSGLVAAVATCAIFSCDAPACIPRDA